MTQLEAERRADTNAVHVQSEEARVAVTGLAAAERAAAAPRPLPADPDTLRHAAGAGDLTALRAQLAAGGDIDARDAQGRTALLLATLHGQPRAVALLLADGADPNAADAQGTTPLQAAVAADEREIIALLRRYGAR
ncbi:MAG TPA: ankyrin repeat domain-containing protein [Steroidobacteraceae bacterium]|nr:ankyrin repeat domain-containing protein [Steroidobacteraceae bacterium]